MRRFEINDAGRPISAIGSRLLLSLLLVAVVHGQASVSMNRTLDGANRKERRRIKKKDSKHFALDALVDGFDGDDAYFVSYEAKKKSKKSEKKEERCKGKGGKSSSKKKKKEKEKESSSSDDSDDDFDECSASPTVLVTDAPTVTPTIEPTEAPTLSPTLSPTTLPPTIQPTVSRTDAPTMLEDGESSEKSEKSKKEKSTSEKGKKSKDKKSSKDERSKVQVSTLSVDTRKGATSTMGKVEPDTVKTKRNPMFRSEIPISIPFPAKAPLQAPTSDFWNNEVSPSPEIIPVPLTLISIPPSATATVMPIQNSTTLTVPPTIAPSLKQSSTPTIGSSLPPLKSETRVFTMEPTIRNVEAHNVVPSTTLVEASAFYVTFLLADTASDPTNTDMKQAVAVCTTFLENYAHATFSLIDASKFVAILTAPFSFSPDLTRIELLTAIEFEDSSEFIPSTEDIDMLLEIAFSEPSFGTLLELLKELPNENPFRQTTSVTRTEGSLQLQLSSSHTPPPKEPSESTSSKRGILAGACAAAFVVVAFAAVYRNQVERNLKRKRDRRMINHPDFTAETNESSIGAPTLMEQLVGDNDINTIEFYGLDDEPPYLDEASSHQGSLFESPFLQGELPRRFNEV